MVYALIPLPVKNINLISPEKGSPGTGSLFYFENFTDNQNRFNSGSLVNTAKAVRSGGYAMELSTAGGSPFTTTTNTVTIGVIKELFESRVAFEMFIRPETTVNTAGGMNKVYFEVELQGGGYNHHFAVSMTMGATTTTGKLQYRNSAGNWVDVSGGGSLAIAGGTYYRLKVVIDPVAKEYVKIVFGALEMDMSGISYQSASSTSQKILLILGCVGIDATVRDCHYDDISVTYNET